MYRMPLGGALLNGGPQQARRVVSASTALVCAASVAVGAWVDRAGAATASGSLSASPWAVADRAGVAETVNAVFAIDPPWPHDLVEASSGGVGEAQGFAHAIRAGASAAGGVAEIDPNPVVYAFYANAHVEATVTADGLRTAYLESTPTVEAGATAYGFRLRATEARPVVSSTATVSGDRYSGGYVYLDSEATALAAPRINGVQEAYWPHGPWVEAEATATAQQLRMAGGRGTASVEAHASFKPSPGRGAAVRTVNAEMAMTASWWRYTYQNASGTVEGDAKPGAHAIRCGAADTTASWMVEAPWSLWQEVAPLAANAYGGMDAMPDRIRPQSGTGSITATADAYAWRIRHVEASASSLSSASPRPSINLTNNAPAHRSMVLAAARRSLQVPSERRVMRVRA